MEDLNPYNRVIGLTGVMGSGKSTVAELFRAEGAQVLDADELSRFVINPTSPYYAQLRAKLTAAFTAVANADIFLANGELNRQLLGRAIFGDERRVSLLNSIMHPVIQREFSRRVSVIPDGTVIIYDVPLLFERNIHKRTKASILVYAPEEVCVARAVKRAAAKGQVLSEADARARLKSQISIEKKRELADYIIDNSGDLAALKPQVAGLYQKLKEL